MFKKFKDKLKGDEHSSSTPQQGASNQQSNLHPSNPYYASSQQQPQHHSAPPTEKYQQHDAPSSEKYQAPPGPPPGHALSSSSSAYAPPPGPPPSHSTSAYQPPPGPPPSHSTSAYQPPPGPPPSHSSSAYQPPPGPPPSHSTSAYQPPPGPPPSHSSSAYQPPPGPPPSHSSFPQQPPPSWDPPPYHDWTVIPDTSQLPPPPSIGYESSPTANATMEDGDRADQWCKANPLWRPQNLTPPMHAAIQNGQLAILKAPTYIGDVLPLKQAGHWKCRTHASCKDASLLTNLPMYSVIWDSPLSTHRPKTIYFELKVLGIGRGGFSLSEADAGIAIGFVAPPYPTFRLPGWQRGSLGVHGDDGRKYVNDTWGGVDFTTAFQAGDTVGIGMTFSVPRNPPSYEQTQMGQMMDIDVFFTRNGKRERGWDGNEELDERSEGGTVGIRGDYDLFPAIGVFGGVDFEVLFHPSQWLYKPF